LSLSAHKGQTQQRDKDRDAQKILSIHSKNLQLTGTVALKNAHMCRHKLHFSPTLTASSRGDLHKNFIVTLRFSTSKSTALLNFTYRIAW
jgi:hypothetical protein